MQQTSPSLRPALSILEPQTVPLSLSRGLTIPCPNPSPQPGALRPCTNCSLVPVQRLKLTCLELSPILHPSPVLSPSQSLSLILPLMLSPSFTRYAILAPIPSLTPFSSLPPAPAPTIHPNPNTKHHPPQPTSFTSSLSPGLEARVPVGHITRKCHQCFFFKLTEQVWLSFCTPRSDGVKFHKAEWSCMCYTWSLRKGW